jgi:hypothetical protein
MSENQNVGKTKCPKPKMSENQNVGNHIVQNPKCPKTKMSENQNVENNTFGDQHIIICLISKASFVSNTRTLQF